MIDGWKLEYDSEPMIENDFDHYKITFPLTVQAPTDKTTDKTTDKALSDMERAIMDIIVADPGISQNEMSKKLDLTVDGIRYHMDKLKERKVIKRIGGKKTGRWEVIS